MMFAPESALVHGRVTVGNHGALARVGFMVNGDGEHFVDAESSGDGDYEALVFPEALGPLTRVEVLDPPREPELDFLRIPVREIRDGTVIDFQLADNALSVTAIDGDTGLGIPGAEIRVSQARTHSEWNRRFIADGNGKVVLPPIPQETELAIEASATGYRHADPVLLSVTEDFREESTTLLLEPEGETGTITLLLPDGSPAAGAAVAVFPSLDGIWVWEGLADAQGNVSVPEHLASGWICGTHDEGGWLLFPWRESSDEDPTVSFPARGQPLSAKVVTLAGDPVPFARLRVWLRDRRIGDALLAWLTGGAAAVSAEGFWVCRNPPPQSLEVLAWNPYDRNLDPKALAGEYDYLRTTVRYPWMGWNEVEAIVR
jgi:hypothetical protein